MHSQEGAFFRNANTINLKGKLPASCLVISPQGWQALHGESQRPGFLARLAWGRAAGPRHIAAAQCKAHRYLLLQPARTATRPTPAPGPRLAPRKKHISRGGLAVKNTIEKGDTGMNGETPNFRPALLGLSLQRPLEPDGSSSNPGSPTSQPCGPRLIT